MEHTMRYDVFISYRREGGDMAARALNDELVRRGYRVFYDVNSMGEGTFPSKISDAIHHCTDFLLVLSPGALNRCNDEDDWVRREIKEAMRDGKNIIPVLCNGFVWPAFLPDDIDGVQNMNGIPLTGMYFNAAVDMLKKNFLHSRRSFGVKRVLALVAAMAVTAAIVIGVLTMSDIIGDKAPTETSNASRTRFVSGEVTAAPDSGLSGGELSETTALPSEIDTGNSGSANIRQSADIQPRPVERTRGIWKTPIPYGIAAGAILLLGAVLTLSRRGSAGGKGLKTVTVQGSAWSEDGMICRSTGDGMREYARMITSEELGEVLWIEDMPGGWFSFTPTVPGDYEFIVDTRELSYVKEFDMSFEGIGKARFTRSFSRQSVTLRKPQVGKTIYWRDLTTDGRLMSEPFRLMIRRK